jgi:hypothetical protein
MEYEDTPPIPCVPARRRSIEVYDYLDQPTDDLILFSTSLWSKFLSIIFTLGICGFCAPFIISLHSSMTIEGYQLSREMLFFGWGAVIVALGFLLVLLTFLTLSPVRFDRRNGTVGRGGVTPGAWGRNLSDIVAIQICRGKAYLSNGDRGDTRIKLQYQLNLVFHDSPPSRRNLCECGDLRKIERDAKQIAVFLDKSILNYTSTKPGSLSKVDSEAQRLIALHNSQSRL